MILASLTLQNFRNYRNREFSFSPKLTLIIGPNTAGKTNILEAIYLLATGGSFRAGVERQMIAHEQELARVSAKRKTQSSKREEVELEIVLTTGFVQGRKAPYKRYLVNGIGRRKSDFVGNFYAVLFNPQDIELITDSPGRRRAFLDNVLVQTGKSYARALTEYEKALRRRNKILSAQQENLHATVLHRVVENKNRGQLEYWDRLLVENGKVVTRHRERLINFLNKSKFAVGNKHMRASNSDFANGGLDFRINYASNKISFERLRAYAEKEAAAGHTLIGPHRDDFVIQIRNSKFEIRNLSAYGSRGEQRLAVLWIKLGELNFLEEQTGEKPALLLDDIFSELDHKHRKFVEKIIPDYQTIITTADEDYIHYIEDFKKIAGVEVELISLE